MIFSSGDLAVCDVYLSTLRKSRWVVTGKDVGVSIFINDRYVKAFLVVCLLYSDEYGSTYETDQGTLYLRHTVDQVLCDVIRLHT